MSEGDLNRELSKLRRRGREEEEETRHDPHPKGRFHSGDPPSVEDDGMDERKRGREKEWKGNFSPFSLGTRGGSLSPEEDVRRRGHKLQSSFFTFPTSEKRGTNLGTV